ncbi:MAG: hypothetical protein VW270_13080 [Candidatus Poseidoniales archaeon]
MRTCIDHLLALPHIDGPRLKQESSFIAQRLDELRVKRIISNEAFLDAGAIQGAIEMIANLVESGVPQAEIHQNLRGQLERAMKLESKHPGLNLAIEQGRAS